MTKPTDEQLRASLGRYDAALKTRAKHGQRAGDLVELDNWRRGELTDTLNQRAKEDGAGWLTVDELGKLMNWKLAHGKWRPRLQQMVRSNPPALVKSTTTSAYPQPPSAALKTLCTLKAVGPATASALLALWHPSSQPFLSDEAHEAVGLGKADYTEKSWARFVEAMQARAEEGGWEGVAELERGMWAWGVEERHGTGEEDRTGDPKAIEVVERAKQKETKDEEESGEEVEENQAGERVASKARKAGAKFGGIKRTKEAREASAAEADGEVDEGASGQRAQGNQSPKEEDIDTGGPARATRSSKRSKKA